ncbi:hypothetical protein AKO1_002470 [Acrasis kona]|uniref:Uncharacterized protein n=1 Tax=Acrasis kona TaxID=1008807 RepID=A0AAW2ZLX3_9EUKA
MNSPNNNEAWNTFVDLHSSFISVEDVVIPDFAQEDIPQLYDQCGSRGQEDITCSLSFWTAPDTNAAHSTGTLEPVVHGEPYSNDHFSSLLNEQKVIEYVFDNIFIGRKLCLLDTTKIGSILSAYYDSVLHELNLHDSNEDVKNKFIDLLGGIWIQKNSYIKNIESEVKQKMIDWRDTEKPSYEKLEIVKGLGKKYLVR